MICVYLTESRNRKVYTETMNVLNFNKISISIKFQLELYNNEKHFELTSDRVFVFTQCSTTVVVVLILIMMFPRWLSGTYP